MQHLSFRTLFLRPVVFCLLAVPVWAPRAWSQAAPPEPIDYEAIRLERVVTAVRAEDPIVLDGRLDEAAWSEAVPASGFTQRLPDTEFPSRERTEARFVYDDDNLYVGVYAYDSEPGRIVINDLNEDYNFRSSDGIGLILDSLRDLRSGFLFNVNAAGARADYQVTDGNFNQDWDAVWDVRTEINEDGWAAEIMIPFKTLRFSDDPEQVWGVNLSRRVLRANEESYWSPIPLRYSISRVAQAGTLEGLEGIEPGTNLKIKPYVIAGFTQAHSRNNPMSGTVTDDNFDGGLDLKYSFTPSLTLDATYRTDFAQVEIDQQQVNLTRFNLFFPEKREFFLENAGTFTFGGGSGSNLVPFFSRRIGLSDEGLPIPIVGGARVTGRAGRYDVGVLSMRAESASETPANNYTVGRLKRNLLTNSWVGALVTMRDSSVDGDYNRVYGADAFFQFFDRLEFDAYVMGSETPGRDGDDMATQVQAAWRDDELVAVAGYDEVQADFNPEAGFVRRSNVARYNGQFSWNPLIERSAAVRNLIFGAAYEFLEGSASGEIETRSESLDLGVQFQNNGSISFSVEEVFDRLNRDFTIRREVRSAEGFLDRPGVTIPVGDYRYRRYAASVSTNPSLKISGSGNVSWGGFWDGHRKAFGGSVVWKPDYHLNFDISYEHNRIELPGGRFTTDLVGARFGYSFTSRAFLNAFLQYNAENRTLSSNIRFRFIHHPLSDLYLVFNDLHDTNTGQLIERAFTVKLTNLFDF